MGGDKPPYGTPPPLYGSVPLCGGGLALRKGSPAHSARTVGCQHGLRGAGKDTAKHDYQQNLQQVCHALPLQTQELHQELCHPQQLYLHQQQPLRFVLAKTEEGLADCGAAVQCSACQCCVGASGASMAHAPSRSVVDPPACAYDRPVTSADDNRGQSLIGFVQQGYPCHGPTCDGPNFI